MPVIRVDEDVLSRLVDERARLKCKNFSEPIRGLFKFRDDFYVKASEVELDD